MAPPHEIEERVLELVGVTFDDAVRVLTEDLHLTLVALAHTVALEAILVAALLLTHLAVPSELLETFGFDSVGDCFWREKIVLTHLRSEIIELKDRNYKGNIDGSYAAIRENANISAQIDGVPCVDTPLHAATTAGHIRYAMEIMRLIPSFATKSNHDGTDQKLKMASKVGEIQGLYSIIKEDQYILERIDQLPFADTPLHIAASKGHTQFALEIMRLKPLLAKKLIQDGFSPMHLALQNQSFQTALRLADVNEQLVCLKGRMGETPLHFAIENKNLNFWQHY
ncbi:hypothetical protein GH714_010616 [Hevea brasiliensis]|uniref:Uncharacterized protein n=1 Tax=Hevea brasiliensis TaxID=3981 RepID=A0A6A6N090_HEVBR|nr:hypothetical protein GH714_010616 [Hevea brasiliensis]